MDNSEKALSWIHQAIYHWTGRGIKLQEGISIDYIHQFERLLEFTFPEDFIALYSRVNGFKEFDWNEHMFSLWSLERILKEYGEARDRNYIGFCDFLIDSHSVGFYKFDRGIYKCFNERDAIAENFQEFILLLNSNDYLLY